MSVSKVGLGWTVGERNYTTLADWITAKKATGVFEDAWCSGNLGTAFATIAAADFTAGALIYGDVVYDGSNHAALPFLNRKLDITSTTGLVVVQDLWVEHVGNLQTAVGVSNGNLAQRLYITHTLNAGGSNAILNVVGTGRAKNCIVKALNPANVSGIKTSNTSVAENCVSIGSINPVSSSFTGSAIKRTFAVAQAETTACQLYTNGIPPGNINNASTDATGGAVSLHNVDPYSVFVDYDNGDYRVKTTSDLFVLNIGAFFEDTIYIGESTFSVQASAAVSVNDSKVGAAAASMQSALAAAAQGTKIGYAPIISSFSSNIVFPATKVASGMSTLVASSTFSLTSNKIGFATISMEAEATATLYAGTVYQGEGTFSISAAAAITLQGSKVGKSQVQFDAAAAVYCQALKVGSVTPSIHANLAADVTASKTGQSSAQVAAHTALSTEGFKVGFGSVTILAAVTIDPASNNHASLPAPVTIVFVRTSSCYQHQLKTISRYGYTFKTHSGGARV